MMSIVVNILLVTIVFIIISYLWKWAEKIFYGKVTPRLLDDVIALVLAIAIVY